MLKLISIAQAQFMKNEDGATAIEYGLIAAGISVAIATVVFAFGDQLVAMFESLGDRLEPAADAGDA